LVDAVGEARGERLVVLRRSERTVAKVPTRPSNLRVLHLAGIPKDGDVSAARNSQEREKYD
jgi:hypothetical protein